MAGSQRPVNCPTLTFGFQLLCRAQRRRRCATPGCGTLPSPPPCTTGTSGRAGRPIATETYGKKREHGSDPGDLGWKRLIPFRLRSELAIYCVQSWNARRNGRDIAVGAGVLHAAKEGSNAGDDTACNTSVSAYLISAGPCWIMGLLQRLPRPITLRASRYRTFSRRWAFCPKTGDLWVKSKVARAAPTKGLHVSRVTRI